MRPEVDRVVTGEGEPFSVRTPGRTKLQARNVRQQLHAGKVWLQHAQSRDAVHGPRLVKDHPSPRRLSSAGLESAIGANDTGGLGAPLGCDEGVAVGVERGRAARRRLRRTSRCPRIKSEEREHEQRGDGQPADAAAALTSGRAGARTLSTAIVCTPSPSSAARLAWRSSTNNSLGWAHGGVDHPEAEAESIVSHRTPPGNWRGTAPSRDGSALQCHRRSGRASLPPRARSGHPGTEGPAPCVRCRAAGEAREPTRPVRRPPGPGQRRRSDVTDHQSQVPAALSVLLPVMVRQLVPGDRAQPRDRVGPAIERLPVADRLHERLLGDFLRHLDVATASSEQVAVDPTDGVVVPGTERDGIAECVGELPPSILPVAAILTSDPPLGRSG